jgi:hypothetical protein
MAAHQFAIGFSGPRNRVHMYNEKPMGTPASAKKKGLATCVTSPFEAQKAGLFSPALPSDQKFLRTRMPMVRGAPYTTLFGSKPPPVPMAAM